MEQMDRRDIAVPYPCPKTGVKKGGRAHARNMREPSSP